MILAEMGDQIPGAQAIALTAMREPIIGAPMRDHAAMTGRIPGAQETTLNAMRDPAKGVHETAPAIVTNHRAAQSQCATVVERKATILRNAQMHQTSARHAKDFTTQ